VAYQTPADFTPYPWMKFANQELGVTEASGGTVKYFNGITNAQGVNLTGKNGATLAWCSAFANWCMTQARFTGTGKSGAASWLSWGVDATIDTKTKTSRTPPYGSIVLLSPNPANRDSTGHVGFFVTFDSVGVAMLGGNQDNVVQVKSYTIDRVRVYRWPSTLAMPAK
jgi:uncharacterized protein (TIGR02594 family)